MALTKAGPSFLLSHPTGNTFVRAVLQALSTEGLLDTFITTVNLAETEPLFRILPSKARRQARRRAYSLPPEQIIRRPQRELIRLLAGKSRLMERLTVHETGWASFDAVAGDLDRFAAHYVRRPVSTGREPLTGVYCYEDCALQTFKAAQERGLRRVYDLPIAYWEVSRALLDEEALRYPAWEPTLLGTRDSAAKNARKTEELALAEVVVTPSAFVYRSLPESVRLSRNCYIAPFGSPSVPCAFASDSETEARKNRPLRVLFAGSMTQRKGLADLFAAFRLLQRTDVELVVMGSLLAPLEFYRHEMPNFCYEPSRPHAEVLALMRTCDVFVLPSIVEGRALVQQEALACGLPLIVTPNAGGEDLIDEGETGFLVPIRSPERIAEQINYLAEHRDIIPHMRRQAQTKAAAYTWQAYGDKVVQAIQSAASSSAPAHAQPTVK